MDILPLFIRTALIYVVVLLVMRLKGIREIGKLSVFDLVISMMIAEIAAFAIEDARKPLMNGLVPIFSLLLIQIATPHLSLKKFRNMLDGRTGCLIQNNEVDGNKQRLPEEQLAEFLNSVRYAGLPLPLIMDGKVQDDNLDKLGKTRFWLKNQIQQKGAREFKEVFFCSIDHNGILFLDRNRK